MTELKLVQTPPKELRNFMSLFEGEIMFCSIPPDEVAGASPYDWRGSIDAVYPKLMERQQFGWRSYFVPNYSSTGSRAAQNITACRAVFADDDIPRENHRTDFKLEPSIIVESSKGKFHYYWLTFTEDICEWSRVQHHIIRKYQTDNVIHDPGRLMRLPCMKHESGFTSAIIGGNGESYTWDAIKMAFPPILKEDVPQHESTEDSREIDEMISIIVAGKPNTGLHRATRDFAYGQIKDGVPPKTVEAALRGFMAGYDMSDPRQKENYEKINGVVYSAYKKFRSEPVTSEVPEIEVLPLERDWDCLLNNPIPKDCLPAALYEAAKEVGDTTAVGKDPAILSGLSITCSLLGKNVVIHEIGSTKTTYCQMGLLIAMPTGTRKTQIYEQMNKPFFDYETILSTEWQGVKNQNKALVALIDDEIKKLQKKAASVSSEVIRTPAERLEFARQMGELQDELDSIQVAKPSLYISDITEEKLIKKMSDNAGAISVISDDARNVLKNILGRYSEGNSAEGVYINGLTGSTIKYDRVRDDTEIVISKPCLNALLFVQPDLALRLKQSAMYIDSGLAARLPIYFYPIDPVELVRKSTRRELDTTKMKPYYDAMEALCVRRQSDPLVVKLTEKAQEVFNRFNQRLADMLESKWKDNFDKVNKIITQSVIYSTVIASLDDPSFASSLRSDPSRGVQYELTATYANMGVMFAEALFDQSLSTFNEIEHEPIVRKARSFILSLMSKYEDGFIWEGFLNNSYLEQCFSMITKDNRTKILNLLVEKGWLYCVERPAGDGPGRGYGQLNKGYPGGQVKPNSLVYHLNEDGVKKHLRLQDQKNKDLSK